jgi:cell division protein DivIC
VQLVFGATALIVVYFLVMFAGNFVRGAQLDREESRIQAEIDQMREHYQRLEALELYLQSDEYIEAIAREQLGLVKEGETAIVAIPTQPSPTPAPDEPRPDLWWEVLVR